jgi:catechol 2,3-dioxygenase-like lactoylglutathione lyase family enzyme
MNTSATSFIESEQAHTGLAVTDIAAAIGFYTGKPGFKLVFTRVHPPTFAGVNLVEVQMFLQRNTPDPKGCVTSHHAAITLRAISRSAQCDSLPI